jgi:hypothetical protein
VPTIQSGTRGRTQDRAKLTGGEDRGVRHESGKTSASQEAPEKGDGLPTGKGTAATRDVSDPHPSNEEQYDRQNRPGGPEPRKPDFGPNDAVGQNVPRRSK